MPYTEIQLISASLAGDEQAFGKLYESYVKRIYQYLYYRTFHKETAEDLTSQTFIRALEHLPSYDASKGSFSAWLYRIARNALIDQTRSTSPSLDLQDNWDLISDKRNISKDVEHKDILKQVQIYIKNLTPEQREVMILRIWDERSYAEIAEIVDKSEAACKMTVSRTLTQLRKHIPITTFLLVLQLSLISTAPYAIKNT